MKAVRLFLLALMTLLMFGCRKQEVGNIDRKFDPSHGEASSGRDEQKRRIKDLDLAIALWYSEQGGAAMVIQPFVDIDIKPITRARAPSEILKERREIINSPPRVIDPEEPDLAEGLKWWWKHQTSATNALRKVLGRKVSSEDGDQPPLSLLDEQESLLKEIQKERDELALKLGLKN